MAKSYPHRRFRDAGQETGIENIYALRGQILIPVWRNFALVYQVSENLEEICRIIGGRVRKSGIDLTQIIDAFHIVIDPAANRGSGLGIGHYRPLPGRRDAFFSADVAPAAVGGLGLAEIGQQEP